MHILSFASVFLVLLELVWMDFGLRVENGVCKGFTAPSAVLLTSEICILFLKMLNLLAIYLKLVFFSFSIIFRVYFRALFKVCISVSFWNLLILVFESKQLREKMLFGNFRVRTKRLIAKLWCVFQPVNLLSLLKTKLLRHKMNINTYL